MDAQIDVFDDCGLAQRGECQGSFVLLLGGLAIDHPAEPMLEDECGTAWLVNLTGGEPEGNEAFVGVADEYRVSFLNVSSTSSGPGCCRAG